MLKKLIFGSCVSSYQFIYVTILFFFLISCGISSCKTPRFAWLNILTSWLLYFQTVCLFSTIFSSFFQTVLLFSTIFSSFPLLESSLRLLLLIHCPDGFSACQRILFPTLACCSDIKDSVTLPEIVVKVHAHHRICPRQQIQQKVRSMTPRPEIASSSSCCCHRRTVCFYARSPPSLIYEDSFTLA